MPTLSSRSTSTRAIVGANQDRCLYCRGARIVRKGKRRKKLETVQLWYCKDCDQVFTPKTLKGKTYPIPVILDGLSYYALGHSLEDAATLLQEHYGVRVTPTTLSNWLKEYRPLCPYARLRNHPGTRARYSPYRVIESTRLHHRQVYHYRIHRPKLDLLADNYPGGPAKALPDRSRPSGNRFTQLARYLLTVQTACPHRLFREEDRGSTLKHKASFDLDGVTIRERQNLATRITQLAFQGAVRNNQRHDMVQKFMLINDAATVATEVPVWLTPEDIRHFKRRLGFLLPFEDDRTITGHIDLVQIRNDRIHILDYKPNADKEKPIEQLTLYALALSRRTGLRLYDFTCAWFDHDRYFEFFPLQVVWKRPGHRWLRE